MAIPFIKHSFIGKSKQSQPYTAAAHVRYISRLSATNYRYAERMPVQWHAAQRFLNEREDSIRKNGRVIDKLVISIPREMTMDQAVDAIRNFGFQLSDGRAPFYFTIQDWDSHNPHCHFILVDADIETGKRVFKTTDKDSSERIKELWEGVCNRELKALGIDASISFSEAAEKKAQRLEEETYANDNEAKSPPEIPDVESDSQAGADMPPDAPLSAFEEEAEELIHAEEETYAEDALEGDEDMAEQPTVAQRVARVQSIRIEKERLAQLQTQREDYWRQFQDARVGAERASLLVADAIVAKQFTNANVYQAELTLKQYQRENGKLRGWRIPIINWKSRTRVEAEQAEAQLRHAQFRHASKEKDYSEAEQQRGIQERRAFELERKATQLEIQLRVLGTDAELAEAEKLFEEQIRDELWALQSEDLEAALERGEITEDQFKEILYLTGRHEELQELEEQNEGPEV